MKDGFERLESMYSTHHKTGGRLRQSFIEQERAAVFLPWIGKHKDVLDLGCRDGTLTRHFIRDNNVTGGDIDAEALSYASATYGIKTRQVDLNGSLPFTDASFDVVVLAETIEHLPYPSITLSEIARVLRDGGLFIGNAPLAYHVKNRLRVIRGKMLDYDPTHCRYFSYDSLMKLLGDNFHVEEVVVLKGGWWGRMCKKLFARNIAFRCWKKPNIVG